MTQRQAALPAAWCGSTTTPDWSVDWDYNRDDPQQHLPSVGLPAGPSDRMGEAAADPRTGIAPRCRGCCRARASCSTPRSTRAWDAEHGGLYYGFAPDGTRLRRRQVLLGAGRIASRRPRCSHARTGDEPLSGTGTTKLWTYSWAAFRRSQVRRVVSHPHARQPQVQRREKPGRQDRLPHHGRVLRSAERHALNDLICHEQGAER